MFSSIATTMSRRPLNNSSSPDCTGFPTIKLLGIGVKDNCWRYSAVAEFTNSNHLAASGWNVVPTGAGVNAIAVRTVSNSLRNSSSASNDAASISRYPSRDDNYADVLEHCRVLGWFFSFSNLRMGHWTCYIELKLRNVSRNCQRKEGGMKQAKVCPAGTFAFSTFRNLQFFINFLSIRTQRDE